MLCTYNIHKWTGKRKSVLSLEERWWLQTWLIYVKKLPATPLTLRSPLTRLWKVCNLPISTYLSSLVYLLCSFRCKATWIKDQVEQKLMLKKIPYIQRKAALLVARGTVLIASTVNHYFLPWMNLNMIMILSRILSSSSSVASLLPALNLESTYFATNK